MGRHEQLSTLKKDAATILYEFFAVAAIRVLFIKVTETPLLLFPGDDEAWLDRNAASVCPVFFVALLVSAARHRYGMRVIEHPKWYVPALVNLASGYVMNANNTPYIAAGPGDELKPDNFSPLMGIEDDQTNRSRRSIALLEAANADGKLTAEEIWTIKYDTGYEKAGYSKAWMDRIAALDLKDQPAMQKAQALLGKWDWDLDGTGPADALALMVLRPANGSHYQRKSAPDPQEILQKTVDHLTKYFGRIDPPMMELLRLRQGDVDLPIDGGNDTIRASTLWDVEADGRLSVRHGDSFIMFMEWDQDGNIFSQSIQPFGAATTRPDSKHYTDQMQLFVDKKLKPVWFDPVELEKNKASEKMIGNGKK